MIQVERLSIQLGNFCLDDVSFEIPTGEYGVLMGKTGSGKTTILEAICGLRPVRSGRILLMEEDITHLKPAERGIGFVPQESALFSTLTVREHLAFALRIRRVSRPSIQQRVDELAGLLQIGHLLERRPDGLSGGESQRVALGRALAFRPAVLCLDEPLSALDDQTKDDLCDLLRSIRRTTGVTTLHITHSLKEAGRLATRIFRLVDGRIHQSANEQESEEVGRGPSPTCSAASAPAPSRETETLRAARSIDDEIEDETP